MARYKRKYYFIKAKYFPVQDLVWSNRVEPYNRPGCIGIKVLRAGTDDEGRYSCTVNNSNGQATFNATLLVDCKFGLFQKANISNTYL